MSDYDGENIRKYLKIRGLVQGVGFRYRAEHATNLIGTTGWVRNDFGCERRMPGEPIKGGIFFLS